MARRDSSTSDFGTRTSNETLPPFSEPAGRMETRKPSAVRTPWMDSATERVGAM